MTIRWYLLLSPELCLVTWGECCIIMMTSSNRNIFRITGHLCGEFTGRWWIPKGQWRGALMFSLICFWINGWVNNREAGDLRRYRAHYDVIVMIVMVTWGVITVRKQTHQLQRNQWRDNLPTFGWHNILLAEMWYACCGIWDMWHQSHRVHMVFANGLAPNRCQSISYNHDDMSLLMDIRSTSLI